jgi:hypothetical protein
MLARTLAARVRDDLLLASSLACLLLRGYASRATASDADDITIDEDDITNRVPPQLPPLPPL